MPDIPVKNCTGCTACASICPKSAINMVSDDEGFLYPAISMDKCVDCGACEKACPVLSPVTLSKEFHAAVVAQSENPEILSESTSGGFIDALYDYVLNDLKGYAAGVAFDENFLPVHTVTDSYETAKKFRNSKYAQSDLKDTFSDVRRLLLSKKSVMFVGTPCQVAGLKKFLCKDYDNLITVDLVCRSIPSPKLWRMYLDWQENRKKNKIRSVSCRKKTYGYHSGTLEIEFENNKKYSGSNRVDYYMKAFHSDVCSRPSCYDCQFKTEHRCSDFTVFDCWEVEAVTAHKVKDNDKGFSNVIAHTEKGRDILKEIKNISITEADPFKMFEFTGKMESQSINRPSARDDFYIELNKSGFYPTLSKFVSITVKDKAIEKAKPVFYFFKK